MVESISHLGIIATVLASGGTILKALELSSSDSSIYYSRRSRRVLLAARDGIDPEWALITFLWGGSPNQQAFSSSAAAVASDPKRLIERWLCDTRSAISIVEDIFSIFTALSAILPVIVSIMLAILGGSNPYLFFIIIPFQMAVFVVIAWWIKDATISLP